MWTNTKPLTSVILAGIVVVVASVSMYRCDRNKIKDITNETLKEHEETAVIVDPSAGRVTTIKRANREPRARSSRQSGKSNADGNVVETIDGAREVRVSVGKDGQITITARTRGVSLQPGFGAAYANGDARFLLDIETVFHKRHSLLAGLNVPVQDAKRIRGHIAYGYTLPFRRFSNTTLLVGFDSDKKILGGVRVRF